MEYLEEWRKNQNLQSEVDVEIANNKNRNIIFSAKDYNFLQEIVSKRENIPMCSTLEFAVDSDREPKDSIAEMFRKANCLSLLMVKAMEHSRPNAGPSSLKDEAKSLWQVQNINYFPQILQTTPDGTPTGWENQDLEEVGVVSFDLRVFLERIINSGVEDALDGLSEHLYTLIHDGYEMNPFSYGDSRSATHARMQMNALLINGMLHNLVEKRMRSFSDIMHGKMAQTEVVFYEIEKIKIANNGDKTIIQRFWVPNFVGRETIELIDSQVKHGGTYQYGIFAWTAIFGNTYQYDGAVSFNNKTMKPVKEAVVDSPWARTMQGGLTANLHPKTKSDGWRLGVVNRPTLRLARLPYYEFDAIKILDSPPIAPQVDIVPYRGINNKLKINFNASADDYMALPIALESSDFSKFVQSYQAQYGTLDASVLSERFLSTGKAEIPLRFRSDDLPRYFQVFRIGFAPTKWSDFDGGFYANLDVEEGDTTIVDDVTPNTDYWYTFRSVDVHGNISNPSNILHVKLVDDQGVFPIIEPYDFESALKLARKFKKPVRRFFQITPVFEQLVFKDERQEDEKNTIANQRNIRLGVAKDSIYGKRLKFRITSKKSGRKIDLNISFTHKHLKPPQ
jgi:hypothetical protein